MPLTRHERIVNLLDDWLQSHGIFSFGRADLDALATQLLKDLQTVQRLAKGRAPEDD